MPKTLSSCLRKWPVLHGMGLGGTEVAPFSRRVVWAGLPHPAGRGEILCGMAAHSAPAGGRRFNIILKADLRAALTPDAVFQELRAIFVQRFLCEELKTR